MHGDKKKGNVKRGRVSNGSQAGNGVFLLLLVNVALFVADHWLVGLSPTRPALKGCS
jgi:hypothetical protein